MASSCFETALVMGCSRQWSTLAITTAWIFVVRPPRLMPILILLPPFAPLAARCAFTIVLSIQVQTVARFCRQRIENTLPHSSPSPAVEPIVRAYVRAVAFGQIAPRDAGPQHVNYCIYDPPVVRARALPTLRHQRLENRPFLIAE